MECTILVLESAERKIKNAPLEYSSCIGWKNIILKSSNFIILRIWYFRYELKGYDENYEEYMKAYGIPSIIVALIVGKPETLIVTKPEENESFYTMKKITG